MERTKLLIHFVPVGPQSAKAGDPSRLLQQRQEWRLAPCDSQFLAIQAIVYNRLRPIAAAGSPPEPEPISATPPADAWP